MSGLPLILIVLLGLVLMVLGITKLKMHPFIVLLLTKYFIGLDNAKEAIKYFKLVLEKEPENKMFKMNYNRIK